MQTKEMYQQLQQLLPRARLLRPAPLIDSAHRQQQKQQLDSVDAEAVAQRRSYVDDLRWLLQCSEVVLEEALEAAPQVPISDKSTPNEVGRSDREAVKSLRLAILGPEVSKTGLSLRLHRADGHRCER